VIQPTEKKDALLITLWVHKMPRKQRKMTLFSFLFAPAWGRMQDGLEACRTQAGEGVAVGDLNVLAALQ
jgi:hypothetical protein